LKNSLRNYLVEKGALLIWLRVCVLSVVVGPDGLPEDIKIKRPLGHGLNEKAIEAVKQWKFDPARKNGVPVGVRINVDFLFRLY
jgi:periplasmic protein TonB